MTHISSRATRDMGAHFARLTRELHHRQRRQRAQSAARFLPFMALAALVGWYLAALQTTCTALPQIVAQSQALAAW